MDYLVFFCNVDIISRTNSEEITNRDRYSKCWAVPCSLSGQSTVFVEHVKTSDKCIQFRKSVVLDVKMFVALCFVHAVPLHKCPVTLVNTKPIPESVALKLDTHQTLPWWFRHPPTERKHQEDARKSKLLAIALEERVRVCRFLIVATQRICLIASFPKFTLLAEALSC